MVAYSFKEKIGRLVLRENIELNFKDINLKILIIGVGTGEGIKYQTIKGLVFDKNQDFNIEQQLTFTFKTVSDWERTHD